VLNLPTKEAIMWLEWVARILAIMFFLSMVPMVYLGVSKKNLRKRSKEMEHSYEELLMLRKATIGEINKLKELTTKQDDRVPKVSSIEGSLILFFKHTAYSWPAMQALVVLKEASFEQLLGTVRIIVSKRAKSKQISEKAMANAITASLALFKGVNWVYEDEYKKEYRLSGLGGRLAEKVKKYFEED